MILSTQMGEISGAIAVFSDLSVIKEIHSKLIQSERMAALGEMSYAVAHELRNPLNVVRGLSEVILENVPSPEKVKEFMEKIVSQTDRLEMLVQQITEYVSQRDPIYDNNLILPFFQKSVESFKRNYLHKDEKGIDIIIESKKELHRCDFDRTQISQVFYNILKNALDAVQKNGRICIGLDTDEEYLMIKISDDGKGMKPEVLAKAFEAFYTTYRPKRTGLGLAVCKGIVERHNGMICLESDVDKGTTVNIKIPLLREGSHDEKKDTFN